MKKLARSGAGIRPVVVLLAPLAAAIVGCRSDMLLEDGAAAATVYGTVADGAGAAIVNASISAEVRSPNCAGAVIGRSDGLNVLRTTSAGRYSVLLRLSNGPGARCVQLSVLPSGGGTATKVELPHVDFRFFNTDSILANVVIVP
jgi:hypothetical protein